MKTVDQVITGLIPTAWYQVTKVKCSFADALMYSTDTPLDSCTMQTDSERPLSRACSWPYALAGRHVGRAALLLNVPSVFLFLRALYVIHHVWDL